MRYDAGEGWGGGQGMALGQLPYPPEDQLGEARHQMVRTVRQRW